MSAAPIAVVDVGSNSTRLFLCEGIGATGPDGERITTITGLRRGAAADGTVTDEALERLRDCLTEYADRIAAFGASDRVIAIGTSAVRDAPNQLAIRNAVAETLGTTLRVLDGAGEAELAYVGARLAVDGDGPVLVVDIGGGSTELVRGDADGPEAAVSLDVGAVRFTEAFLLSDPPTADEMRALRHEVATMAVPAMAALGGVAPVVGVAGTMTSLAAIARGAYDPDVVHGAVLSLDEVEDMAAYLGSLPLAARQSVPGLHPARASSIVAGALIAATVLGSAGVDEVAVSERDLLDGAVLRIALD